MKRPPFKMVGSRWAQSRRTSLDPRRPRPILTSGRASHVWLHGVIVPMACGLAPDGVEIRAGHNSPWHRIDYTADEAYALLLEHWPRLRGLHRTVEGYRERAGR